MSHPLHTLVDTAIKWRLNGPQRGCGHFGEDEKKSFISWDSKDDFMVVQLLGIPTYRRLMCHLWSGVNEKKKQSWPILIYDPTKSSPHNLQ